MTVDKKTVAKMAHLARIGVADGDLAPLTGELNNILGWVEQLSEVDTDDVAPMTSVVEMTLPMRDDVVTDGGKADDILKNAPQSDHGFFVVPKVIE